MKNIEQNKINKNTEKLKSVPNNRPLSVTPGRNLMKTAVIPKEEINTIKETAEIKAAPTPISSIEYILDAAHQNKNPDKPNDMRDRIK
ncbi:MAG: hypothetical protein JRI96_13355 [Deltaproteobacteria bacterium]|nr:hypothetical protein [Deltaproteobacteria bacterium]